MGSYLSIVNNTPDAWQCKLSHDEAALKIAGIVIGVIGSVATVIATAGAAAPLAAALTANGVVSVFGVSTSALAVVTGGAAAVSTYATALGTVSGFGIAVAKGVTDNLQKDGYHVIPPGGNYRWGKMSLSLWQQGTCIRIVNVDERTVRLETLYLRPIFSGSTANANRDHDIQWWLNKNGVTKEEIVAKDTPPKRALESAGGTVDRPRAPEDELRDGEMLYFFPNGSVSHATTVWDHQARARALTAAAEAPEDELRDGEIIYFYANGTQTKSSWR